MSAMSETEKVASAYSFQQITNTHHIIDEKKRNAIKCVNALIVSMFRSASPYLPLVACAFVNYSLHNGVVEESAAAFFLFGYFKIALEESYEAGCYWGNVVNSILSSRHFDHDVCTTSHSFMNSRSPQTLAICQTDLLCTSFLTFFTIPFKESAVRLFNIYQRCLAFGHIEIGLYALRFSLEFSFHGGEKLSLILNSTEELIKTMLNHTKEGAKFVLANKIVIDRLVGVVHDENAFPAFGGLIHDEDALLVDAQSKKNFVLIEAIHVGRFNSAFWMGDYIEASKLSRAILALPSSKMPKIQLVIHTFFKGLIAFQTYMDGREVEYLDEGKQALDKLEIWNQCKIANFQNKLLLLEAVHYASIWNVHTAKEAFNASIQSARNHGLVQEQGLACELYGKFLSSIIETDEAINSFKSAHACYMQWGAVAKAEQVRKDHNLDVTPAGNVGQFTNKHGREW